MANKEKMGGSATSMNPTDVQKYLGGMAYPASKQDIIGYARSNNAPTEIMNEIDMIPDKSYNTPADVQREMGS